jgi:tRNA G18 (ribose-2'-O)-methylase SpoU
VKRFSENIPSESFPGWKVTLVLDNLRSAHNVGNILRIAEALQLEVIACGYTPSPPHPVLAKTAMDCDRLVKCRNAASAADAINMLRNEGCRMVLALEHNQESSEVWSLEKVSMPLALVLGNEAKGISPEALALCDKTVDLPMLGSKASINVGNASAAALYAIYAKYKNSVNKIQVEK